MWKEDLGAESISVILGEALHWKIRVQVSGQTGGSLKFKIGQT